MNVTVNLLEIASEMAHKELVFLTMMDYKVDEETAEDLVVCGDDDEVRYKDKYQEIFNRLYDKYYDLILNISEDNLDVNIPKFTLRRSGNDNDLFAPDGGVAIIRFNGECMLTDYYHEKIDPNWRDDELWERLAEGKMQCKEWTGKTELTQEMIDDAINWLGFDPNEVIIKIIKYI